MDHIKQLLIALLISLLIVDISSSFLSSHYNAINTLRFSYAGLDITSLASSPKAKNVDALQQAKSYAEKSLLLCQRCEGIHRAYMLVLVALGEWHQAVISVEKEVKENPNDISTLQRALTLYKWLFSLQVREVNAKATIQPLINTSRVSHRDLWYQVGLASQEAGKDEMAKESFEDALTFPATELTGDSDILYQQAALKSLADQPNERIARLEKAVISDDFSNALQTAKIEKAKVYKQLGHLYLDQKRFSEAIESYNNSLKLLPNDTTLHTLLAEAFLNSGKLNEAIEIIRLRSQLLINYPIYNSWKEIAERGRHTKEYTTAEYALQKALETGLPQRQYWYERGNLMGVQQYIPEATAAFQMALQSTPTELMGASDIYYQWGIISHDYAGDAQHALKAFQQAVEQNDFRLPGNVHASSYFRLGILYAQAKNWSESINHYRQAITLSKYSAPAYHAYLGNALWQSGELKAGKLEMQKAIELQPDYIEAYSLLGNALLAEGNQIEARKYFERILEIDPQNSSALTILDELSKK